MPGMRLWGVRCWFVGFELDVVKKGDIALKILSFEMHRTGNAYIFIGLLKALAAATCYASLDLKATDLALLQTLLPLLLALAEFTFRVPAMQHVIPNIVTMCDKLHAFMLAASCEGSNSDSNPNPNASLFHALGTLML